MLEIVERRDWPARRTVRNGLPRADTFVLGSHKCGDCGVGGSWWREAVAVWIRRYRSRWELCLTYRFVCAVCGGRY